MTTSLSERNALKIATKLTFSEAEVHCDLHCQARNRIFFTIVKRYFAHLLKKHGIQVVRTGICKGNVTACPRLPETHLPDQPENVRVQLTSPVGPIEMRFFLSGWKRPMVDAKTGDNQ